MAVTKKNNKKNKKTKKTKKTLKDKKVTKVIRSGSTFEKLYEFWTQLTASKRKLLFEVGDALTSDKAETRRIRVSLLPKPIKPKKPMTSFMLFAHENHERFKTEHPDWKMTQIAQAKGQEWNTLAQDLRDQFKVRKVPNNISKPKVSHRLEPKEKERRAAQRLQAKARK